MAKIKSYANPQLRIWGSLGHLSSSFYYWGPIVGKKATKYNLQNHETWDCRGKERHMEGKEETHPRPKAQRGGKARGNPHIIWVKGTGVIYSKSLVGQPMQGGGRGWKGRTRRNGEGKPALKLPASFRLTTSCTFLLAPLLSKRHLSAPSQPKVFLDILLFKQFLANGQAKSADVSQGGRGGLRTASAAAAAQSWHEACRRDGVCRSLMVPAPSVRGKIS